MARVASPSLSRNVSWGTLGGLTTQRPPLACELHRCGHKTMHPAVTTSRPLRSDVPSAMTRPGAGSDAAGSLSPKWPATKLPFANFSLWPSRTGELTAPNRNCAARSCRPMSYDRFGTLTGLWRSPSERSWTTHSCPSAHVNGCPIADVRGRRRPVSGDRGRRATAN